MPTRDYYNVLGVERGVDTEGVKLAYRRLAMRWHPDRNGGDPVAELRFKAINEAYRVLVDPVERERYDRLGVLWAPDGQPLTPDHLQAAVSRAWSNLRRGGDNAPGENIEHTVTVTLEEIATGTTREILVARTVQCRDCTGLGATPSGRALCEACKGTGRSEGRRLFRARCFHCDGRGFTITERCPTCLATGRIAREDVFKVRIPAGAESGVRLRLAEKGNEPAGNGVPGDLFVAVDVVEHPLFRRNKADLHVTVPLSLDQAALGDDVTVPTLEGLTSIRVPPSTPHGRIFRLAGRGLPFVDGKRYGDLLLEIAIEVPVELSTQQQAVLRAWSEPLGDANWPARTAFRKATEARR